jgi:GTP-binding protein
MAVPKVAIVGRPNVGKSSLFNWMAKKMIAIVDGTAGTTRDRMRHLMHEGDRYFEIIDTGGMGIVDSDDLTDDIENQIELGLAEADLLVFVVDGKDGVVPLDRHVAERLRPINKPKLLVVNKCDSTKLDDAIAEFFALANCDVVTTSVKGNRNRDLLLQKVLEQLPPPDETEGSEGAELEEEPELKLAIVGRRKTIIAIDTPGVRKKKSLANDIEFYGLVRAQRSIRRADVVLMLFDSQETISRVDKQLVEEIAANYKPCIFVVNKWDEAAEAGMTMDSWGNYLLNEFASIRHSPIAFITAKENRNIKKVINLAQHIFKQSRERVGTGVLNRVVRTAVERNRPPMRKNKIPKIYYATQVGTQPPTIVLKVNDPILFDNSWKRYLLGVLQAELEEELRFPNQLPEGVDASIDNA